MKERHNRCERQQSVDRIGHIRISRFMSWEGIDKISVRRVTLTVNEASLDRLL